MLTNLQTTDAGSYAVAVSNPLGATSSSPASLVVHRPPVIASHPASLVVTQEQNASTLSNGALQFRDPISGSGGSRFYRVRLP